MFRNEIWALHTPKTHVENFCLQIPGKEQNTPSFSATPMLLDINEVAKVKLIAKSSAPGFVSSWTEGSYGRF